MSKLLTTFGCFLSGLCLLVGAPADAQQGEGEGKKPKAEQAVGTDAPISAHIISVPVPIVGTVDTTIKRQVDQILSKIGRPEPRPYLIFEFSAKQAQGSEGSEFERSLSLARYIASDRLTGVRTVAFVPSTLRGHAVLPVLACEQIVIAEDAELGEAGIHESFVDETVISSYKEIAERRLTIPVAVVMGMIDKKVNVHMAQTASGVRYVLDDELQTLEQQGAVTKRDTIWRSGDLAKFTGRDLRVKYGFVTHLARDRQQLASALNLPNGALQQDPSLAGKWLPIRIDVRGPINSKQVNWIERSLKNRLASGEANFVCIVIDSAGGAPLDSLRLANTIAGLDPSAVRTVAFVESQARADAALIALACDQLVIGEEAVLGGPGEALISQRELESMVPTIISLMATKGRDWSLAAAMIDPTLAVSRYTRGSETRYFSDEELNSQEDPGAWSRGETLPTRDGIKGGLAEELKLATLIASDISEIRRVYHIESEFERLEPNWAHMLIEHLASPRMAGILLFIAWFAFMIELSQPGVGLPGFIASICIVLYFWSNFLHGTAGWLEVLLFITGVMSVLVELFLVPGTAVFGIGGGLLIISSIVLASQTFIIPRNSYQLGQFPSSLMMVAAAGAGAFVALVLVRKYLTEAPVLNRMVLAPPDEEEIEERDEREALAHLGHLVGKRGRSVTPLMPSGKARFGDDIVNVATNGEPVSHDVDVIAIANRGNYLLVQAAEDKIS